MDEGSLCALVGIYHSETRPDEDNYGSTRSQTDAQ